MRGALDLGCEPANLDVQLTERPYVGVTRYEATGCGATRSYVCSAKFYSVGFIPMGERSCKQAGAGPDAAISPPGRVAF